VLLGADRLPLADEEDEETKELDAEERAVVGLVEELCLDCLLGRD